MDPLIQDLTETLVKDYDPEEVILFGSRAKGTADEYSDVDLVVIKDTQESFLERLKHVPVPSSSGVSVDILVYTPKELQQMVARGNPFLENVLREGLLLYQRPVRSSHCPSYADLKEALEKGLLVMKPDPKEEGRRWLSQADLTFARSQHNYSGGFYAGTCFECQQAAEMALKAFLYSRGERFLRTHSVEELRQLAESHESEFATVTRSAKKLDRLYLTTRYPDALPGGVPAENFEEEDAQQALEQASQVIELVRKHLEMNS